MARYDTDGSSALAPNDPYNNMEDANYRPKFGAINGGKSRQDTSSTASPATTPANNRPNLRVIDGGKSSSTAQNNLRDSENKALSNSEPSFYRSTGKSNAKNNKGNGIVGAFIHNRKKSFAGIILSVAIMAIGGTFLGSTNSLLAPALNEVVTEATDYQHAANLRRFLRITSYQLNNNATETSWTGKLKYSAMSESFKRNLERGGITVNGSGTHRTLTFNDEVITANDFERVYKNNLEFHDAYNKAKRGRILGFFDERANKLFHKLGNDRDLYRSYKETNDAAADKEAFDDTIVERMDKSTDTSLHTNHGVEYDEEIHYTDPETGEDRIRYEPAVKNNDNSSGSAKPTSSTTQASSYLQGVTSNIQQATSIACTAMDVVNMISIAIAANEIYQSIDYFLSLAENPSKMKMGYGNESGINSMLNFMTTSATTEVEDFANYPANNSQITQTSTLPEVGTVSVTGSPMESKGMIKLMTGMGVLATTGMANYSLERVSNSLSTSVSAFHACNSARTGTALVSIAVSLIPGVGQAKILSSFFSKIAIGAVASISVQSILSFLIPTIARAFFTNPFENTKGIPAGELYAKGAAASNSRVARTASGQNPSSESAILAYSKINQEVIAQDAAADRHKRSPFDITSKNTFLGSIAYNFGTTTSTGVMGKIKNLMRNTSSSLSLITGQVHADANTSYMNTFGNCPTLEAIGVKGDMYCNPITTTDPSILELSPEDTTYINVISQQLTDENGVVRIDKNGNLAKYITYCTNRDSPFGVNDVNILNNLSSFDNGAANAVVSLSSSLPVIGDILDIVDAGVREHNLPWATGAMCSNDPVKGNPDWDTEYKYYQLFVTDQRVLENMGNETNIVADFIEEYEAEHPLDNSPSSYLARISGLSPDDAQLVLDIAWYYNFLENYDPSTRIAMDGTTSDTLSGEAVVAKLDHELRYRDFAQNFRSDRHASRALVAQHPIYADIRNRSYAV